MAGKTYNGSDAHAARELFELLPALANLQDGLLIRIPGAVGHVLDHEALQRRHMLLEDQVPYLRDGHVRLGREALRLVLGVSLEHEKLLDLLQLGCEGQKLDRHIVRVDLAQGQRGFPILFLQQGPDRSLCADVQEREALEDLEVHRPGEHGSLDGYQVDAERLQRQAAGRLQVVTDAPRLRLGSIETRRQGNQLLDVLDLGLDHLHLMLQVLDLLGERRQLLLGVLEKFVAPSDVKPRNLLGQRVGLVLECLELLGQDFEVHLLRGQVGDCLVEDG